MCGQLLLFCRQFQFEVQNSGRFISLIFFLIVSFLLHYSIVFFYFGILVFNFSFFFYILLVFLKFFLIIFIPFCISLSPNHVPVKRDSVVDAITEVSRAPWHLKARVHPWQNDPLGTISHKTPPRTPVLHNLAP